MTQLNFDSLEYLRLQQLADSALPIGTAAHSFGLESLVADGILSVPLLEIFLSDYLQENGILEASFCRAAYLVGTNTSTFEQVWLDLNTRFGAFKVGREAREASASLGRRFLQLALNLGEWPLLYQAGQISQRVGNDIHLCTAFGLTGYTLEVSAEATVLATLHQSVAGLISACQRLLPLGQNQASRILWNLKPAIVETTIKSRDCDPFGDNLYCFNGLLEGATMRHPALTTRLFIS